MMIKTTLTILAAGAVCAAASSVASAQSYSLSPPGATYSPASNGYPQQDYRAAPGQMDDMPNFDDVDDAPSASGRDAATLSSPGPILSPDDPRYGRGVGAPRVYSNQGAPQGSILSPDDPRYGRPYQPSPAYSDRGNGGYGNAGGMRPPAGVGQGVVTGSVPPVPMGSDGRPTSLSALPPDDQPEADQGGEAQLAPNLRRQEVSFVTKEPPGTIIVDTPNTYLYYVLGNNRAIRYGVRVGRDGFTWTGVQKISRKAEWPDWHPPTEMIERQPYLPRFMAGGPGNPLGARAMYLGSTVYRIHGTNQPSTIGKFVSSGCIGMLNEDVEDLFERAKVGTRVVVWPGSSKSATANAGAPAQIAPQPARSDATVAQAGSAGTTPTVVPPLPAPVSVR